MLSTSTLDRNVWFLASMPSLQGTHCVSHPSKATGIPPILTTAPPAWLVSLLAEIPQVFTGNNLDFNYKLFNKSSLVAHLYDSCFPCLTATCNEKPPGLEFEKLTWWTQPVVIQACFPYYLHSSQYPAHHEYLVYTIDKWMNEEKQEGSMEGYTIRRRMSGNTRQLQSVFCLFSLLYLRTVLRRRPTRAGKQLLTDVMIGGLLMWSRLIPVEWELLTSL